MIKKWYKKIKDSIELKKSNWGRDYNWYIEYDGQLIGELVAYECSDMFWDSYIIRSLDKKWDQLLTKPKYWNDFKFKNQYYKQYAMNAFAEGKAYDSGVTLNQRITMRGLYLIEINGNV